MNFKRNGFSPKAVFALRSLLAGIVCSFGGLAGSHADEISPVYVESYTPPHITSKVVRVNAVNTDAVASAASVITLGALDGKTQLKQVADAQGSRIGVPLSVGVGRSVVQTATDEDLASFLNWTILPSGHSVAALRFVSPGAAGVRLSLNIVDIDPRSELRFRQSGTSESVSVTGMEILDTIFLAESERPGEGAARVFVGPYVDGEDVTFEVVLPQGVSQADFRVSIPKISHLFVAPLDNQTIKQLTKSGSCNVDAACRPEWSDVAKGVARMLYTDPVDAKSYVCTGTLINDSERTGTPYFLTANHCIDSQVVASTMETFWFYENSSCNSRDAELNSRQLGGGGTMLFTNAATDTTFMRLNRPAPAGALFQGWTTAQLDAGISVGGVHHPRGGERKISLGQTEGYASCTDLSCSFPASPVSATHLLTKWRSGVTEPGSSGSGLFWTKHGNRYLVGQLTGGTSSCANPSGWDVYGRFDVAYSQALRNWLDPEPAADSRRAIHRFFNTVNGSHFYTASVAERNHVVATHTVLKYEGVAFYAYPAGTPGYQPVYRFFNRVTGTHFYTISAAERDHVRATAPVYAYEGEAWSARTAQEGSAAPLYRFFHLVNGTHFYTSSAAERDHVRATAPLLRYEGVAYYGWSSR